EDPGHEEAKRDCQNKGRAKDEEWKSPHDESSLSTLEPLGTQQCEQEINKQEQGYESGQQDHNGSFHTRSQAATNANISPSTANPSSNIEGSQIMRFIVNPSESFSRYVS